MVIQVAQAELKFLFNSYGRIYVVFTTIIYNNINFGQKTALTY